MEIKGIIDNWIISNITLIGATRDTKAQIYAPYSIWSKHPSMGVSNDGGSVAQPLAEGDIVGLMDMGMWTLGTPKIEGKPIIDYYVSTMHINPACYKEGNLRKNYQVLKGNGCIMGQYRGTKLEFFGKVNPLFDAPWGDEFCGVANYSIDVEHIGSVILGNHMQWNGATISYA